MSRNVVSLADVDRLLAQENPEVRILKQVVVGLAREVREWRGLWVDMEARAPLHGSKPAPKSLDFVPLYSIVALQMKGVVFKMKVEYDKTDGYSWKDFDMTAAEVVVDLTRNVTLKCDASSAPKRLFMEGPHAPWLHGKGGS